MIFYMILSVILYICSLPVFLFSASCLIILSFIHFPFFFKLGFAKVQEFARQARSSRARRQLARLGAGRCRRRLRAAGGRPVLEESQPHRSVPRVDFRIVGRAGPQPAAEGGGRRVGQ